jgi:hypothetical protein
MRIDIITVLPELMRSPFEASIMKRAIEKELVEVHFHNLRDYTTNKQKSVDDYQFGGGAGMVMTIQPIDACISKLKTERTYDEIIYMTPDGETLNQTVIKPPIIAVSTPIAGGNPLALAMPKLNGRANRKTMNPDIKSLWKRSVFILFFITILINKLTLIFLECFLDRFLRKVSHRF